MYVLPNDSLRKKLTFTRSEQFSLDYWLFLSSDQTPRIYQTRPIGLKKLRNIISINSKSSHSVLREAISLELESYRNLSKFMNIPVPNVPAKRKPAFGSAISREWIDWINQVDESFLRKRLSDELISKITSGMDISSIAFLLRRVSCEYSDDYNSRRAFFGKIMQGFFSEKSAPYFSDCLEDVLYSNNIDEYLVEFTISHVPVKPATKKALKKIPEIEFEKWKNLSLYRSEEMKGDCVCGLFYSVRAKNYEEALVRALEMAQETLKLIRSKFRIFTRITRAARVTRVGDGVNYWVPLPKPFWRESVLSPEIPKFGDGIEYFSPEYNSTIWHVSHAINNWSEDISLTSSQVWQAIEAWSGNIVSEKRITYQDYYDLSRKMIKMNVESFIIRMNYNSAKMREIGEAQNWKYYRPKVDDLWHFFSELFNSNSSYHHSKLIPYPVDIAFHQRSGILNYANMVIGGHVNPTWMSRRIYNDMLFLYGLRCLIVHSGNGFGEFSFSEYLSGLGVDIVNNLIENKEVIGKNTG